MGMRNPPHPGDIVKRQCLEPLGLSVTGAPRASASRARRFRSS